MRFYNISPSSLKAWAGAVVVNALGLMAVNVNRHFLYALTAAASDFCSASVGWAAPQQNLVQALQRRHPHPPSPQWRSSCQC